MYSGQMWKIIYLLFEHWNCFGLLNLCRFSKPLYNHISQQFSVTAVKVDFELLYNF